MATNMTKISKLLPQSCYSKTLFRLGPVLSRPYSAEPYVEVGSSPVGSGAGRIPGGLWLKDYEDYRKSLYGGLITHKALFVDAVGTLVVPAQPTAQIYRQIGEKYGVKFTEDEILRRYRWAYEQPWMASRLRYVDDGRPFWQYIVSSSTGCSDSQYFEELYTYFMTEKAWHLCDPNAGRVFQALRNAGVKVAIVSNFDT